MSLAQGAAPQADEGMGENRYGGQTAEGRMERIAVREGVVSGIAYHGRIDAAERYREGSLPVLGVLAGLIVICAVAGGPAGVAFASTQSIIALPQDVPQDVP